MPYVAQKQWNMIDNKFNTITYENQVVCFYRDSEFAEFLEEKKKINHYISYYDNDGFVHVVEFSCQNGYVYIFGNKYDCRGKDAHECAGEIVREHRWYNFNGYSI